MYEAYWQLDSKPFENTSNPKFYYPAESHQGALLKLRYAVENRRCAALLSGASGLGKSLLTNVLSRQLPEAFAPWIHVVFPHMPAEQLLAYLQCELTGQRQNATIDQSVREIQRWLAENAEAGRHTVIVIDEAQVLEENDSLETIRLLLNIEHQSQPPFTLLLVGQPAILPVLDRMPELDERLAVKCLIKRFGEQESMAYVQHRLEAAGAARAIFDDEALAAAHQLSHGVPRRINRLCDLALLIGYAEERSEISAAQIHAVAEELVAVSAE